MSRGVDSHSVFTKSSYRTVPSSPARRGVEEATSRSATPEGPSENREARPFVSAGPDGQVAYAHCQAAGPTEERAINQESGCVDSQAGYAEGEANYTESEAGYTEGEYSCAKSAARDAPESKAGCARSAAGDSEAADAFSEAGEAYSKAGSADSDGLSCTADVLVARRGESISGSDGLCRIVLCACPR